MSMVTLKFALRGFDGRARDYYLVEESDLPAKTAQVPAVSDLILVVDASGSMCGDMAEMREMIRKVLAVDEYNNAALLVTLISYSGTGDLVTHFERVPVGDVMRAGSAHQRQVQQLQVRGMTCISQALGRAREVAARAQADGSAVGVCLMSDGYCNDPSVTSEKREIDRIVEGFRGLDRTFVSTVAFRSSSDFQLLAGIANRLSGSCIQASGIRQVYDAMHDVAKVAAGSTSPAIALPVAGADYQIFLCRAGKKIVGSAGDLLVRGLAEEGDRVVYRYRRVKQAAYRASEAPEVGTKDPSPVFAFARAMVAEGCLNAAKYALVASRCETLLERHARALTGEQVAALADDLDRALWAHCHPGLIQEPLHFTRAFGDKNAKLTSVLDLCRILDEHKSGFEVDALRLATIYKRRGIRRVSGTRDDRGRLVPPHFRTVYKDAGPLARVGGLDVNRNTATINMMVVRPVALAHPGGAEIREVAGVRLDCLAEYRQYTIVGDGALNVDEIWIRVSDKRLWKALARAGALAGDLRTDPVLISLRGRPLVSFKAEFDAETVSNAPDRIFGLRILSSVLHAVLKGSSVKYTPEQVEVLREHWITDKLYVNFPTTLPYADEKSAVMRGEVDYRVSYKVNLGTPEALSPESFYSANEFLARYYACEGATDPKKPKCAEWLRDDFVVRRKDRSRLRSRSRVDDLMETVFDDFFLVDKTDAVQTLAQVAAVDGKTFKQVRRVLDRKVRGDEAVETLSNFLHAVDAAIERVYTEEVSPLVFYVGASGLLPDDFGDVSALDAEQLIKKFPGVSLSKDEREATFYVLGRAILSVYARSEPYSTEEGARVAKEQEREAAQRAAA